MCLMGMLLIPLPAGARHSSHGEPESYSEEVLLRSSKLREESVSLDIQRGHVCIPTPIQQL